ncbi:prephenate dehydratase [Angustibacter aerolatus]
MTTGYLGPRGTFCQAALLRTLDDPAADVRPMPSVDAALSAVRSGELDAAMVPIENSVEGGVPATMDALGSGSPLQVVAEALLPVTFVLAARPGTALADVRRVGSHPHGWAQCRGWVAAHLPGAAYVPAVSTAAAAEALSLPGEPPHDAALCAPIAAETFGLDVLARDVGDTAGAVTRFLLVTRPGPPPARTGADRTSVVVFQADDHPGGLLELLEQFATRGINLTRIESRPTGDALGRYCFSIDADGHVDDARMGEALTGLHRTCTEVRFLGSYPRADAAAGEVPASTSDAAYADAAAWLRDVRGR